MKRYFANLLMAGLLLATSMTAVSDEPMPPVAPQYFEQCRVYAAEHNRFRSKLAQELNQCKGRGGKKVQFTVSPCVGADPWTWAPSSCRPIKERMCRIYTSYFSNPSPLMQCQQTVREFRASKQSDSADRERTSVRSNSESKFATNMARVINRLRTGTGAVAISRRLTGAALSEANDQFEEAMNGLDYAFRNFDLNQIKKSYYAVALRASTSRNRRIAAQRDAEELKQEAVDAFNRAQLKAAEVALDARQEEIATKERLAREERARVAEQQRIQNSIAKWERQQALAKAEEQRRLAEIRRRKELLERERDREIFQDRYSGSNGVDAMNNFFFGIMRGASSLNQYDSGSSKGGAIGPGESYSHIRAPCEIVGYSENGMPWYGNCKHPPRARKGIRGFTDN